MPHYIIDSSGIHKEGDEGFTAADMVSTNIGEPERGVLGKAPEDRWVGERTYWVPLLYINIIPAIEDEDTTLTIRNLDLGEGIRMSHLLESAAENANITRIVIDNSRITTEQMQRFKDAIAQRKRDKKAPLEEVCLQHTDIESGSLGLINAIKTLYEGEVYFEFNCNSCNAPEPSGFEACCTCFFAETAKLRNDIATNESASMVWLTEHGSVDGGDEGAATSSGAGGGDKRVTTDSGTGGDSETTPLMAAATQQQQQRKPPRRQRYGEGVYV